MEYILIILVSYLIGSIPFSHIFPKLKGKDVTKGGTKNIGATNALVVAGPVFGFLSLIGDIGKGALAAYLGQRYIGTPWGLSLAGLASIIGHDFSVFMKFRGGKGVATTGGVLLIIDPIFALISLLIWILLMVVTRYFILSTLIIFCAIPFMMMVVGIRVEYIVFGFLSFLISIYTHRADVARIISGREHNIPEALRHYSQK